MIKILSGLLGVVAIASAGLAGPETYSGTEMKQIAPPTCPPWYADNEFNASLWGTYLFTGNAWWNDRYVEADHAWGGGGDFKYFFRRYFGVGVEGWAVDARQLHQNIVVDLSESAFQSGSENNAVGALLGTLTLRYPISCTRFSPYIFGGAGAIVGGGQKRVDRRVFETGEGFDEVDTVGHTDGETRAIGEAGAGIEVRFTPHIGLVSDFTWNFVDGPNNNFGMVRTGVNFAF